MNSETKQGTFYEKRDYAGFLTRLFIIAIDLVLIFGFYCAFWILAVSFQLEHKPQMTVFFFLNIVFLYIYLVEIKRRWGTLGNLLTATRVIDIRGLTPTILSMLVRNSVWVCGPIMLFIDILWMTQDSSRQMIRDKLSAIYVVGKSAKPAGKGEIIYSTYMLLGLTLLFRDVKR